MSWFRVTVARWLLVVLPATSAGTALGQPSPERPVPPPDAMIRLTQDIPEAPTAQPSATAPTAPAQVPAPTTPAPAAPAAPSGLSQAPRDAGGGGGSSTTLPVGASLGGAPAAGAAVNAPDLGNLLQRSTAATGVEVQQRNVVSIDPRVRGTRNGQYLATADGAAFFPGRLDLDTPISKFDPGSIRDVRILRGPYTSLLGPGFAYIDIATLDTPRSQSEGVEYHGRTSAGYQTNGGQVNGLQAFTAAGQNWGFRGTYNVLQSGAYKDGAGDVIPASYNSQNFNYALGYDLSDRSSLEFKGLRVHQTNLSFPGLYFDLKSLDTEAYNLRYTGRKIGIFDLLSLDTWYNTTVGVGDTSKGAKQFFDQNLLGYAFLQTNPTLARVPGLGVNGPGTGFYSPYQFTDNSTTRFAERSLGYRLAGVWGNNKDEFTVTYGTDLNVFGQGLVENIDFNQIPGSITPATQIIGPNGVPQTNFNQQQSIPNSNAVDPGLFVEAFLPYDKRLKLRSGGRVDFVRTSSDPRLITGNVNLFGTPQTVGPSPQFALDPIVYSSNPGDNNLTRDFTLFSGFATAEFLVDDHNTLFLNYGYAERAPTLTELYAAGPFIGVLQQGTSRLIGDPNLAKEQMNQLDVGLRGDYGWLQYGANAFYSWIHNYITYDANKLATGGLGLSQVVFTNTDLATLAGSELFVQGNLTDWLTPFGTLSYVQGVDQTHIDTRRPADLASSRRNDPATQQFATQTEALPQIPPLEGRAGFRIHQPTKVPKWQVEFWARMVAGQNNVATSLGEVPTPGFTTLNIRGFWQVTRSWLMSAGVENIGNILYREHLDPVASTLLRANTGIPVAPLYRPGTNFFFTSQLTY